jgi:hypothetical protein
MATNGTIKKLDKVFSEYIRLRDSRIDGYGKCISCGRLIHWKDGDAGHYINRRNYSVRWNEKNVHLQCRFCNRFNEGNAAGYTQGLIKKYGEGIIEELEVAKSFPAKYTDFELNELIKVYKLKIKELRK